MGKAVEVYNSLFDTHLSICKKKFDPKFPYDNLEDCCQTCNRSNWMLFGMITLMLETKEITKEQYEHESDRISYEFCTSRLYNAFATDGQIYVYSKQ